MFIHHKFSDNFWLWVEILMVLYWTGERVAAFETSITQVTNPTVGPQLELPLQFPGRFGSLVGVFLFYLFVLRRLGPG